jgi:hypothetical protein
MFEAGALGRRRIKVLLTITQGGSLLSLRDRALIGLMVYSFVRIALAMKVEDVYSERRRLWVLLHQVCRRVLR